jgi:hypothetical protein
LIPSSTSKKTTKIKAQRTKIKKGIKNQRDHWAMFDSKSRYVKAETYAVEDARGRTVLVVAPPPPPDQVLLGIHLQKQGERLDLLAARYVNDPAGYWRIAEQNDVMLPEALTEAREVEIPVKAR